MSALQWECPGCGRVSAWSRKTCACGFDTDLFSRLALRVALETRTMPTAAIPLLIHLSLWSSSSEERGPGGAAAEGALA